MTELYRRPDVYRRRWALLGVLSLGLLLVIMSIAGVNVALAEIQRDLGVGLSVLQWIINAYTITFGGLLLVAGALGDRFGRKGALVVGLAIFGAAALVGAITASAVVLVIVRAAMGLGAAFVMPTTLSMISNIFAPGERERAIAIWAGTAGVGAAIGPVVTGVLITGWWIIPAGGWEWAFLYNVPVAAVVLLAAALWLPRSRDPNVTPLDPLGVVGSLVALVALLFGIIEAPERGWTSPMVLGSLALSLVVGIGFLLWERRAPSPMLPLSLFAERRFAVGAAVNTSSFIALLGWWFLLILYVQFALGYSPLQAGLATLPEAVVGMAVAPITPNFTRRFGAPRVMAVGFLALAAGFGMLGWVDPTTSYWFLLGPLLLAGVGLSLTTIPATNDIMATTPLAKAGIGSAVNDASREIGAALGIAALGTVSTMLYRRRIDTGALDGRLAEAAAESPGAALERASGLAAGGELAPEQVAEATDAVATAFSSAFATTMIVGAVLCVVGAVAVLALGRRAPGT